MQPRLPRQYEVLLKKARADVHIAGAAMNARETYASDLR